MATTLGGLREKVRDGIRDTVQPYHVQTDEVDGAIRAAMTFVGGKVPLGEKWVAGAITLTANSDTATLPSTVEYHMVYGMRRTSDRKALDKFTVEEMDAEWDERVPADVTPEEPDTYALYEDETGVVTVRFQAPVKSEATLDLRRAVMPADLSSESDAAPLPSLLVLAVSEMAASILIGKLTKNELDQLRLDRGAGVKAEARAGSAIHDELLRRAGLEATGRVHRSQA